MAVNGKTKPDNVYVGSPNSFSNVMWTSLRKTIPERLNQFGKGREGQVQKYLKKNSSNNRFRNCSTTSTVHNAGPAFSAKNQSYHQTSS